MPGYASYGAGVGNYGLNLSQTPDTTMREVLGTIIQASDPVWGGAEFIYARATAAIRGQGLVQYQTVFDTALNVWRLDATEAANVANTGRQVGVAVAPFTAAGQFGWLQIAGTTPVNCNITLAAGAAVGLAAAGQAGTNTAGKQLLGAIVSAAGTTTFAKTNCSAQSGSFVLQVPNSDGWFIGAYLSGTGVGAGATVTAIDPSGRFVTMSLVSTATITGTVTATYNNGTIHYNVVTLNRPFLQGAIT
jgi:hypothetical protein